MQTREREAEQIVTHSCNTGLLLLLGHSHKRAEHKENDF